MNRMDAFSSIVTDIYDCAVDPALWPNTLLKIVEEFDGAYASVHLVNKSDLGFGFRSSSPWDPTWMDRLQPYVKDIPATNVVPLLALDTPVNTLSIIDDADFRQGRFHREWAGPQGLLDGCNMKLSETQSHTAVFSVVTRETRKPIVKTDLDWLASLGPHLRRAILIGNLINNKDIALQNYSAAMDQLNFPLILSDGTGKIHAANRLAARLLETGQPVSEVRGKIVAANQARKSSLAEAILRAHNGDQQIGINGIGIPLNTIMESPVICYVLPLNQSNARHVEGGASVALYFATGDGAVPVVEAVLSTLFRLTPTEIRIAREMVAGDTLREIGSRLEVSENTVKTHARHVFEKTETAGKSDLSRLLISLSPPATI